MRTTEEIKKDLYQIEYEDEHIDETQLFHDVMAADIAGDKEAFARLQDRLFDECARIGAAKKKLEYELKAAEHWELKPGDGVTVFRWSDAEAYTVIKRTPKTCVIRRCKAKLNKERSDLKFYPGGFAAHVEGHQSYDYEEWEDGPTETIRWSEKQQRFVSKGGRLVRIGRHEFYDYNF